MDKEKRNLEEKDIIIATRQIPHFNGFGELEYYLTSYIVVDKTTGEIILDNNGKGYSTKGNAKRGFMRWYLKNSKDNKNE